MTIYVNHGDGDGERELTELTTSRGTVESVYVNHGDGAGERKVWSAPSQEDSDADVHYDARSLELEDGDAVSEWGDSTGSQDAVQTDAAAQPTYVADGVGDNPSVQFDGDQYLEAGFFDSDDQLEQPYTWAAVIQHDPTGSTNYVFYGADTDQRSFLELTSDDETGFWAGTAGGVTTGLLGQIVICVADGEDSVLRVVDPASGDEDEITGDAGTLAHHGLTIGAHSDGSRAYEGLLADLRGYDRRLSASERDELVDLLVTEWDPDYTPPEPESTDATVEINYDDYSHPSEIHGWHDDDYCGFVSSPTKRGETTIEWQSRFTSNHGNSAYQLDEWDLPYTASSGHAYECYWECYAFMTTDFPTAEDGAYTMRWNLGALSDGEAVSGSGSPDPDGTNGWYVAPFFDTYNNSAPGTGEVGYSVNFYDANYGPSSNFYPDYTITPDDSWHKFGFYCNMNSWSGSDMNADGVFKYYHNDDLVHANDDYMWTYKEDNMIRYVGSQWNFLSYDGASDPGDFEWWFDAQNVWLGDDIPDEIREGVTRDY